MSSITRLFGILHALGRGNGLLILLGLFRPDLTKKVTSVLECSELQPRPQLPQLLDPRALAVTL